MAQIDSQMAELVAKRGANRLGRLVMKDGRFIYRHQRTEVPRRTADYNVLRHCGAAWSMLDIATQYGQMPGVINAAGLAIGYLISNHIRPFGDDGSACVVEDGIVKLGGNGLALLAIAELYRLNRRDELLDIARQLGRFILSEQRPDGDFVHSRIYATREERDFRSNYYTGEALFGLLRLHEITGEENWLNAVVFSEDRLNQIDYGVDADSHWMLYALEALNRVRTSDTHVEHARRIAEHIMSTPDYRVGVRSTPIACRSEGLLAYVRLLANAGLTGSSPTMAAAIDHIRTNLALQNSCKTPNGSFIHGGGRDDVQIDYIQHNISAFMGFSRLPASPA